MLLWRLNFKISGAITYRDDELVSIEALTPEARRHSRNV